MKKVISKLVALVISLTILLSVCAACDWITINTDRDMSQVIATVKISDKVDSEDIYKRELQAGFMSYGYQYVSYYSYTTSKAYQTVLDNLVSNEIINQQARIELANTYNGLLTKTTGLTEFEEYFKEYAKANKTEIDPKSSSIENLSRYLSDYEYKEVMYQTRKTVNDLIDSYLDEEEDSKEVEAVAATERTSPTVEDPDLSEKEMRTTTPTDDDYDITKVTLGESATDYTTVYQLYDKFYTDYKIDITSSNKRKKAFSEVLKFLEENGLISSNESIDYVKDGADKVLEYSYFQTVIKSFIENAIVSKYEKSLNASVESKLTNEGLWEEYKKEYNYQEALYKNDITAYETALGDASDKSFVLYNPYQGYGYVMNLLVPFSSEQTAKITDKKAEANITEDAVLAYRSSVASNILATDQREAWVYSSFGKYNGTDKTFKFDKDYRDSDLASIENYIGEVIVRDEKGVTKKDDNKVEQTTWSFSNVVPTEITMSKLFENYVTPATGIEAKYFVENDANSIGVVSDYNSNTFDKFSDLMYTFSTDTGCLGSNYGYLYSPYTTTYVKEFEAASKAVIEKSVGAYTTVLTDYGYHIILCTKLVDTTYNTSDESKTKFMADVAVEDTLAYKYREAKLSTVVSSEISKISNMLIGEFKDDETKVVLNKDTYKDLITEEETEE